MPIRSGFPVAAVPEHTKANTIVDATRARYTHLIVTTILLWTSADACVGPRATTIVPTRVRLSSIVFRLQAEGILQGVRAAGAEHGSFNAAPFPVEQLGVAIFEV
jgi:hypothetical protein